MYASCMPVQIAHIHETIQSANKFYKVTLAVVSEGFGGEHLPQSHQVDVFQLTPLVQLLNSLCAH